MKMHVVKSWPKFFDAILTGSRTHELRRNDRSYHVGDFLELHEFDPVSSLYSGRVCRVQVTSITSAEEQCAVSEEALHKDFCILSVQKRPV